MRIFFILTAIAFCSLLGIGRATEATDIRLMNAVQLDTLYRQGEEALSRSDIDDALKIFTVICSRDDGDNSRLLFSKAYQRRGFILYSKENYAEAMQAYLRARGIAEQNNLHERLPSIYTSIGNIFSATNDIDSGIIFYRRALTAAQNENDKNSLDVIYNNMQYAYYLKENADSAQKYHELYSNLTSDNSRSKYDLMLNQGLLFELKHKGKESIEMFQKAAAYARDSLHSQECLAAAYSQIAHTYERAGQLDSAIKYLKINEQMARTEDYNSLLVESLRDMARIYDKSGDHQNALICKSEYLSISDSLFSRETLTLIKNSQALYEQNRDAYTIRSLSYANTIQKYGLLILFAILAIIVAFSIVIWRQKQKLYSAWRLLYEKSLSTLDKKHERKPLLKEEQRESLLKKIKETLDKPDIYCVADFSIDTLAEIVGSNARYVSEAINEEYGKNFRAVLNDLRVKEAMRRLEDIENYGNYTIRAIAESVGYKSQATFIAVFTKETGLKPSIYQRLARENKNKEG